MVEYDQLVYILLVYLIDFDYLIFDLDKNEKINFKMFEILSEIFIVSGDEKESVMKSRRLLNRLCFYNNITNKKIIVNKAHIVLQVKGFCLMQNEIEELLKTEVLCVIPNFYKYNYFNYKNITKEQRKVINNFCNSFITNKRCENRLCEKFVGVIGFFRRKLYEKFE